MKIDIVIRNIVLKNNTSNKNTNSESKSINHSQITLIENLTRIFIENRTNFIPSYFHQSAELAPYNSKHFPETHHCTHLVY